MKIQASIWRPPPPALKNLKEKELIPKVVSPEYRTCLKQS